MQPEKLRRTEEFTRTFRGYAPEEVDGYVAEILGKYEELYRENCEMIQHLRTYAKREAEVKEKRAEADARLEAAEDEAKRIILRARADGDIIRARAEKEAADRAAAADADMAEAKAKLDRLREETASFVARVTEEYAAGTDRLRALADGFELPEAADDLLDAAEAEAIELPAPPLPEDEYAGSENVLPTEMPSEAPTEETDEFTRVFGNDNYVKELRRTPR